MTNQVPCSAGWRSSEFTRTLPCAGGNAMKRPFGVTVLAVLAGILAVLSAFAALRFFGLIFGMINVPGVFWHAFLFALMAWVYSWLAQMLWNMQPQAWIFLAVVT